MYTCIHNNDDVSRRHRNDRLPLDSESRRRRRRRRSVGIGEINYIILSLLICRVRVAAHDKPRARENNSNGIAIIIRFAHRVEAMRPRAFPRFCVVSSSYIIL